MDGTSSHKKTSRQVSSAEGVEFDSDGYVVGGIARGFESLLDKTKSKNVNKNVNSSTLDSEVDSEVDSEEDSYSSEDGYSYISSNEFTYLTEDDHDYDDEEVDDDPLTFSEIGAAVVLTFVPMVAKMAGRYVMMQTILPLLL